MNFPHFSSFNSNHGTQGDFQQPNGWYPNAGAGSQGRAGGMFALHASQLFPGLYPTPSYSYPYPSAWPPQTPSHSFYNTAYHQAYQQSFTVGTSRPVTTNPSTTNTTAKTVPKRRLDIPLIPLEEGDSKPKATKVDAFEDFPIFSKRPIVTEVINLDATVLDSTDSGNPTTASSDSTFSPYCKVCSNLGLPPISFGVEKARIAHAKLHASELQLSLNVMLVKCFGKEQEKIPEVAKEIKNDSEELEEDFSELDESEEEDNIFEPLEANLFSGKGDSVDESVLICEYSDFDPKPPKSGSTFAKPANMERLTKSIIFKPPNEVLSEKIFAKSSPPGRKASVESTSKSPLVKLEVKEKENDKKCAQSAVSKSSSGLKDDLHDQDSSPFASSSNSKQITADETTSEGSDDLDDLSLSSGSVSNTNLERKSPERENQRSQNGASPVEPKDSSGKSKASEETNPPGLAEQSDESLLVLCGDTLGSLTEAGKNLKCVKCGAWRGGVLGFLRHIASSHTTTKDRGSDGKLLPGTFRTLIASSIKSPEPAPQPKEFPPESSPPKMKQSNSSGRAAANVTPRKTSGDSTIQGALKQRLATMKKSGRDQCLIHKGSGPMRDEDAMDKHILRAINSYGYKCLDCNHLIRQKASHSCSKANKNPVFEDLRGSLKDKYFAQLSICFSTSPPLRNIVKPPESDTKTSTAKSEAKCSQRKTEKEVVTDNNTEDTEAPAKSGPLSIKNHSSATASKSPKCATPSRPVTKFLAEIRKLRTLVIKRSKAGERANLRCKLQHCKEILKTPDSQTIAIHISNHFPKPLYICSICQIKVRYTESHRTIREHPPDSHFEDFRYKHESELIELLKKCFPIQQEGVSSKQPESILPSAVDLNYSVWMDDRCSAVNSPAPIVKPKLTVPSVVDSKPKPTKVSLLSLASESISKSPRPKETSPIGREAPAAGKKRPKPNVSTMESPRTLAKVREEERSVKTLLALEKPAIKEVKREVQKPLMTKIPGEKLPKLVAYDVSDESINESGLEKQSESSTTSHTSSGKSSRTSRSEVHENIYPAKLEPVEEEPGMKRPSFSDATPRISEAKTIVSDSPKVKTELAYSGAEESKKFKADQPSSAALPSHIDANGFKSSTKKSNFNGSSMRSPVKKEKHAVDLMLDGAEELTGLKNEDITTCQPSTELVSTPSTNSDELNSSSLDIDFNPSLNSTVIHHPDFIPPSIDEKTTTSNPILIYKSPKITNVTAIKKAPVGSGLAGIGERGTGAIVPSPITAQINLQPRGRGRPKKLPQVPSYPTSFKALFGTAVSSQKPQPQAPPVSASRTDPEQTRKRREKNEYDLLKTGPKEYNSIIYALSKQYSRKFSPLMQSFVRCEVCGERLEDASASTINLHVMTKHMEKAGLFRCMSCQLFTTHPNQHQRQAKHTPIPSFRDRRSSVEPKMIEVLKLCFPC